jgi:carboxypeptidase T
MPRYLVTIFGRDYDAMADLVREYKIGVLRQTARQLDEESGYSVDALVDSQQIQTLEAAGYRVEVREDIDKIGGARQAEVGKGDRYMLSGTD